MMGAHDCHPEGRCVNTPGGYYCRCVSGYTGDGYTCTDLDDCDPDPCDPVHGTCHDQGANKYGCDGRPRLGPAPAAGQDEDECLTGTHACDANADCFNTYGSYICTCKERVLRRRPSRAAPAAPAARCARTARTTAPARTSRSR